MRRRNARWVRHRSRDHIGSRAIRIHEGQSRFSFSPIDSIPIMIKASLIRLRLFLDAVPDQLRCIDAADFTARRSPETWSRLEILGHLCDSATNNHHRLVRARYEDAPEVFYAQREWVRCNRHQEQAPETLIALWSALNRQLLFVAESYSEEELQRLCGIGKDAPVTIAFIFNDYIRHLEHHLRQILPELAE
jgi:hypothetical protein